MRVNLLRTKRGEREREEGRIYGAASGDDEGEGAWSTTRNSKGGTTTMTTTRIGPAHPSAKTSCRGSRLRKCREVSDGALGNVLIDGPDLRAVVVDGG